MNKGRWSCDTAELLSLVEEEWPPRRGRMLGRLGNAVRAVGGKRFSVRLGRRFVVTKYCGCERKFCAYRRDHETVGEAIARCAI